MQGIRPTASAVHPVLRGTACSTVSYTTRSRDVNNSFYFLLYIPVPEFLSILGLCSFVPFPLEPHSLAAYLDSSAKTAFLI